MCLCESHPNLFIIIAIYSIISICYMFHCLIESRKPIKLLEVKNIVNIIEYVISIPMKIIVPIAKSIYKALTCEFR